VAGDDDPKVYATGGMWIHPCGKTYQEAGRDGFTENSGVWECHCPLCEKMRVVIAQK